MRRKTAITTTDEIPDLLRRLEAGFLKKKQSIELLMRNAGIEGSITQVVSPPMPVSTLPAFNGTTRDLSPMLQARFQYAGTWQEGLDIWLNPQDMAIQLQNKTLLSYHHSLREFWDNSAPMLFDDSKLALFGVTDGVPENVIYLVWTGNLEPEVWTYSGMATHQYKNLAEFLAAQIQPS